MDYPKTSHKFIATAKPPSNGMGGNPTPAASSPPRAGRRRPALLAVALALFGCAEPHPETRPARPVRATTVRYEVALATTRYSGEVKARHEIPLSFQVPGKMAKRLVEVGALVHRGDLLATLDPMDYQSNRSSASARLATAQAEFDQARKDSQHLGNLLDKNLASAASYDRKQESARAAEARAKEAQAALDLETRRLSYTELHAEHDGVITAVEAEEGQVLPAGQTVFRLARTEEKEVVINVPENRLDDLRSATQVQAMLWAAPGVFYPANVREISPGVDATIRTYTVKVSLPETDERVRLGMTATVLVRIAGQRPVVKLPLTALYRDKGKVAVWVVDAASGSVALKPVDISLFDADNAWVVGGLADGERVVTAGVHKLAPGEKVRAVAPE